MKILVTGSSGFICGYLIQKLLANDHTIIGVDNLSKYGEVNKSFKNHPRYTFIKGDAKNFNLLKDLIKDCDQVVAAAAKIGGISYFHEYAYDLISENEKIIASTFDAAIYAFKYHNLKKINILSSSMVFENTNIFPTPEGEQFNCPPPSSTYGFQKLSTEYFSKGAWEQYKLPYTIIRPFNCIGIGEKRALGNIKLKSGNINLAMSHVIPDLVQKVIKGQNPLRIFGDGSQIRHFTYGGDLAQGISLCIESEKSLNEDFNLSTGTPTTILEAANLIWKKINNNKKFEYQSEKPYLYDIQKRSPDIDKARKLLKFEANTSLDESLEEIIPWIKEQVKLSEI